MLRRRSQSDFFRGVPQNGTDIINIDNELRQGNVVGRGWTFFPFTKMHRSTRNGLIGLAILVCAVTVIFIFNFVPSQEEPCFDLSGKETCLSTNPKPYRLYGTKTIYRVANGSKNVSNLPLPTGCTPKIFYMLSRHATRHPDKDDIQRLNYLLPLLKEKIINSSLSGTAKICNKDLDILKDWRTNLEPRNGNSLTTTGILEAEHLAQRWKRRFPSIFKQKYSSDKFTFQYTSKDRTRSTAEAFAKGLFGYDSRNIDFRNLTNDGVLAFHSECKKIKGDCTDPSYNLLQLENFEKGPLIKKVVQSISERVGFPLTREEVDVIHTACVFGFALNSSDIWCSLFSTDELKVFEFEDDLDDYYKDAYGNQINYQQACPVIKYIVNLFRETPRDTKAVMQFSHSGGLKKVYSALGLFKDESPLTADGFCSQANRKWRSSLVLPFNSNIVFVLCSEQNKIAVFHNENLIKIAGCKSDICTKRDFYATYETVAEDCDIKEICKCKV